MATNDKQRQFDQIDAHLVQDYPSLAGQRQWSRPALIIAGVVGGLVWALLNVAMVAWGAPGVVLTLCVVALTGAGLVIDAVRRGGGVTLRRRGGAGRQSPRSATSPRQDPPRAAG